mmetsp:Transcript_26275/g.62209  ORF Transcript_26275/g.62209 Transcript_26275/m.62209 type:complete len:395 (+) Transcript_26275:4406-5590(+)
MRICAGCVMSSSGGLPCGQEVLREALQHAAGFVDRDFLGGVQPALHRHGGGLAVLVANAQRQDGPRRALADDVEGLAAVETQRQPIGTGLELQRQHAHADQVAAVDALEALGHDGLDAQQLRALGGPVAARPGAVLLAGEDHGGRALGDIGHCGVVDRRLLAVLQREAAFHPRAVLAGRQHQVLDPHIGKGAAHHHIVIAAARAIGVEVGLEDAVLGQELAGRRGLLEGAGRADVVGSDRVAEQRHDAGALDAGFQRLGFHREAFEERRLGDVGALWPVVDLALDALDCIPQPAGLLRDLVVVGLERLRVHRMLHQLVDLVTRWPDVAEVDRLALLAGAHRLGHQVARHIAGNRVGDDQRRAGQEVGLQIGMDARLEIAVARQHGRADQVVVLD